MGWLSGWAYRRPVRINNSQNPNNLTNYQVLVTVDTASLISAGKMNSDGSDIRFTDSDGVTLLSYWIESGINTSTTKIWVKVPSIPASSVYTIYMYYGNPSALSQSNPNAVFDFFDDASTDKSSSYVLRDLYNAGVNATLSYDATNKRYKVTFSANDAVGIEIAGISGGAFEVWMRGMVTSTTNQQFGVMARYSSTAVWYFRKVTASTYSAKFIDIIKEPTPPNTAGTQIASLSETNYISTGVWYQVKAHAFGSSYWMWCEHENQSLSATSDSATGTWGLYIASFISTAGQSVYFKDVVVRKYTDPEPTTALLTEETPPPPAVFTPIDELKRRLIFTTTPSFLSVSGSGSINILSPSADTKTLTVRNWWLITNATGGKITLASPSKLFGSLLAKKQKKTGQEDIWATLGMGEPILLYYQGITPDSKVLVLLSWRED